MIIAKTIITAIDILIICLLLWARTLKDKREYRFTIGFSLVVCAALIGNIVLVWN